MEESVNNINNEHCDMLDSAYATTTQSIIKVIGVGGGGGNAASNL